MSEVRKIFLGGCNVKWLKAKIDLTGAYLDDSDAVEFSVYAAAADPVADKDSGDVVTGADSVSMTYVAASDGEFIGHLPASASLVRDAFYWLEVTATPNGGAPHTRRYLVQAVDRGPNP